MHPVTEINSTQIFAIDSNVIMEPILGPWESSCLMLKMDALVKYVEYGLMGMGSGETVTRMTSEMKPEELAEKNQRRLIT